MMRDVLLNNYVQITSSKRTKSRATTSVLIIIITQNINSRQDTHTSRHGLSCQNQVNALSKSIYKATSHHSAHNLL